VPWRDFEQEEEGSVRSKMRTRLSEHAVAKMDLTGGGGSEQKLKDNRLVKGVPIAAVRRLGVAVRPHDAASGVKNSPKGC
jgi:hypothetical protein